MNYARRILQLSAAQRMVWGVWVRFNKEIKIQINVRSDLAKWVVAQNQIYSQIL